MVRILHVLGKLDIGGAESRIMDLYRNMDRNKVQFDFVVHGDDKGYFEPEIEELGGRVYHVPKFRIYNLAEYKKAWETLLMEHTTRNSVGGVCSEFDMLQGHMTSTAGIYLPIAKKCGIKTTIAHARSAGVDAGIKGYLTRLMRMNLADKADYLFTCSELAAKSVFGSKAVEQGKTTFIPNCIDVETFKFDKEIRDEVRKKLGISDNFVVGHVGRFHYAKNHEYILRVFRDFLEDWEVNDDYPAGPILLLIGDGPRMAEMKAIALKYGIMEQVRFLGSQTDIAGFYDAMDYFLYPSRYEGLPGTVVEAQANGLRILMSDEICQEVIVTDLVTTMPIAGATDDWAGQLLLGATDSLADKELGRTRYNSIVRDAGFDVANQAKTMERFYCTGEINDSH